jgi:hypothetical protein
MSSFHLAEGPGGFIEAVCHMRNNPNDVYYGMTLVNNDSKCPGWKKSKNFLEENRNMINWKELSSNPNAIELLKKRMEVQNQYRKKEDRIDWKALSKNPPQCN